MTTLTLIQPDDWHVHLRDGDYLGTTVPHLAQHFRRAIIMPNLSPPVTNTQMATDYQARINQQLVTGCCFSPLMTLYLTDHTSADEIVRAHQSGSVFAVKLYPAGATTNSSAGVTNIEKTYPALAAMEELGLPLLVHGEVTTDEVDVFDREQAFIDRQLIPLIARFPTLPLVFEHITTRAAVEFVRSSARTIAATITPHHLLINRNHMLVGGIKPHYYCLPILKTEQDRLALLGAATSGNPKFFLGTDSAPHVKSNKESSCGCAGIYSSHIAMELYAEAFEEVNALDQLETFASINGAKFYGLPINTGTITLEKTPWKVANAFPFGHEEMIPFRAGQSVSWKVTQVNAR